MATITAMPPTLGGPGLGNGDASSAMFDVDGRAGGEAFKEYLISLLPPLMSCSRLDLERTLFSDATFDDKASRFAGDPGVMFAWVTKSRNELVADGVVTEGAEAEDLVDSDFTYILHLPPLPSHSPNVDCTLSLIKKRPTLDPSIAIPTQLQILLLSGSFSRPLPTEPTDSGENKSLDERAGTPYEGLHNLVHWGIAPWFDSYVNFRKSAVSAEAVSNKKGAEAQTGIPITKRKFAELELALLHLQQNVEIPDTHLVIHPVIQRAVQACRENDTRVTIDAIQPATLLSDTPFLNRLQSDVNLWIKEIQNVTKLTKEQSRDVASGTASQEINFWLSMETALERIERQLSGDQVELVLDVLKSAKRFHATISFVSDTGVRDAMDVVSGNNALMKDFPLDDLLSASDLPRIKQSINQIFTHINKKIRVSHYPLTRTLPLVEAISSDFNDQCTKVLNSARIMYMDNSAFEQTMQSALGVFATWEENIKEFTNVARDVMRRRNTKFIPVKITSAHVKLQERVVYLQAFRRTHEQLRIMTSPSGGLKGLGGETLTDIDMGEEIKLAYEDMKNINVLDVSIEGTEIWLAAEASYNERVTRVENQIIARLRDRLAAAKNAHEMFRVFSRFNSLFVRPKIRGAIQEYQTQLIESVKDDIKQLQRKFTSGYRNSQAYHLAQLRDMPPVSSAIIWARQIGRQLDADMQRVEDVLGHGWEMYAEGDKLKVASVAFRNKLDVTPMLSAWTQEVTRRDLKIGGRLFDIVRQRNAPLLPNGQPRLELAVNFDSQAIILSKEVRNLLHLNLQVPHAIVNFAKEAKRVYPHVVSLMESVRVYSQTVTLIEERPAMSTLLADYRIKVQELVTNGMNIRWETISFPYMTPQKAIANGVNPEEDSSLAFFKQFASAVTLLQEKTTVLVEVYEEIEKEVASLGTCNYGFEVFSAILSSIQAIVDRLNLEGFANLEQWLADLEEQISIIIMERLKSSIASFCHPFYAHSYDEMPTLPPVFQPTTHVLRIRDQVIFLDPPIEVSKSSCLKQLQRVIGVICGQRRLQCSRYEITLKDTEAYAEHPTYQHLLVAMPEQTVEKAFVLVGDAFEQVEEYVDRWLQFQSLWDLDPESVYHRLADSLDDWAQLLAEIRQSRSTFDTSESSKMFVPCSIEYATVQGKVAVKYDAWQKEILNKYGAKLGTIMRDTYSQIHRARADLEVQNLDGSSTAQAVTFITLVQSTKKRMLKWENLMGAFASGQTTLERQRFIFPADWLHSDQVQAEWQIFSELIKRKDAIIQSQVNSLQSSIRSEDKIMEDKIAAMQEEWDQNKPIQGDLQGEHAMSILADFESRITSLSEGADLSRRAKEALHMGSHKENRLEPMLEEIKDLKAVWIALSGVWKQLASLRESIWSTVQSNKIRRVLDEILNMLKAMPPRMRHYAAFIHVQDQVKALLRMNTLVSELRSDAMKERHWRQLFQVLRLSGSYRPSSFTLGQVYDMDLVLNEKAFRDVLIRAQGEMALEEYLRQVKDTWNNYPLDLVEFQSKCRLVRGWDDLFAKCGEHINSLSAMRGSPYFKVFEEEASSWSDKLNRVHNLFDVWVDVQRQWVYLEGIFSGNADIKHLLPIETARFNNINTEFMTTMKKVYRSPLVTDVLAIPDVQKTFERLADALGKIQKALGEYLERERSAFPRFYFVGDEDLLEMLGNSKDVIRVVKHMKKMFAGISALTFENEGQTITGMVSSEGEVVPLSSSIHLPDHRKINEWLAQVEQEMQKTLAKTTTASCVDLEIILANDEQLTSEVLLGWIEKYPAQSVILSAQVVWTSLVELRLAASQSVQAVLDIVVTALDLLADAVLLDLPGNSRRKCEHLINEMVHQRDVTRALSTQAIASTDDFAWLSQMRFYRSDDDTGPSVNVSMADATFRYGFEYLGVPERLVQTPLTDKCYLTLTQALHDQLGGSPFGPAGTGKTESVKALGLQLGRFVLVFCCDENFDVKAMARIFVGLCQVGAWGCFDEFNRLEESMLSAISQQIQMIQAGLAERSINETNDRVIELSGRKVSLDPQTGIFITMNPGYAGRSNLPDNLKKLFRSIAMTHPDKQLIAQVMLYCQGFRTAEQLAAKIVPFFELCREQLSNQVHYDFGLRALKSVLVRAGILKRVYELSASMDGSSTEQGLMIRSIRESIEPKLVPADVELLNALITDIFRGVPESVPDNSLILKAITAVSAKEHLVASEAWVSKIIQLHLVQQTSHGVMLVGPSANGKTAAWKTLLEAQTQLDGVENASYVIDPKAITKDVLYGCLDLTTREWQDGLFTHILRRIQDGARGETERRHWIIFDGDVDPEWVENLNSLLDDNKILTLPNGERLALPENVRILFEVQDLRFATPATVSRCGMIWFGEGIVDTSMMLHQYLTKIRDIPIPSNAVGELPANADILAVQQKVSALLTTILVDREVIAKAVAFAANQQHVMAFSVSRALSTLFSLLDDVITQILDYNRQHLDFPLAPDRLQSYISKKAVLAILWAFAGDAGHSERSLLSRELLLASSVEGLSSSEADLSLTDYDVDISSGNWATWVGQVPVVEVDTQQITTSDLMIPTVDTVKHEAVLHSFLSRRSPVLLCGPPGSGKTMTLFNTLRSMPDVEVAGLNFSSATDPELVLKTFEQYCEYRKTSTGTYLSPIQTGKWLIVFCDEINLPSEDKYGTQRVIAFLRQMIERNGFWRASDLAWIQLDRIQFVGACNPPTDPGRVTFSQRFLRHAPVLLVDYPGRTALSQIYDTFARALLKIIPTLRGYHEPLTQAMLDVYVAAQRRFTADQQAHYVYSPRELTRWTRGLFESMKPLDSLSVDGLIRIWAHEALRLFQDRLLTLEEKQWMNETIDVVALQHFPTLDRHAALSRPILFASWTTKDYVPVDKEQLKAYTKARLRVFYEEELDLQLVLYDDFLDHALRIDRVFRQSQGHCLLIGISGSGKTTLARFVAWMNGLSIFQIKVSKRYTSADFDEDLRDLLRRSGCKGERICFIMDESNILDPGFLERMNTLLANAEIPGLFEGDEYNALMTACKEASQRDGLMLDNNDEVYRWFTKQVARNLHIVFTMNPPSEGLGNRAATSPALFNRCVIDWMGDWTNTSLYQVAVEMTSTLDLESAEYNPPSSLPFAMPDTEGSTISYRLALINTMLFVHHSVQDRSQKIGALTGQRVAVTPRHFLEFLRQFSNIFNEKKDSLEEKQRHIHIGLEKLRETLLQVEDLRKELAVKSASLQHKDQEAKTKLQQMIADQQETEAKKLASTQIQAALLEQDRQIAIRQQEVMADLAEVEPAVQEAKSAVGNIKKVHLAEVRGLARPPDNIKLAMEAACIVLGYNVDSWKEVQSVIRKDDFISSIQNFDTEQITPSLRARMERDFLSHPNFTFEIIDRASKACGPLVQWVIAQVRYSSILDKIGPLRYEVQLLETQAETTKQQAQVAQETIVRLEASIERYKEEYALLVSETQAIKAEMFAVQKKVNRSMTLLDSLASEETRWRADAESFESEMSTVAADSLLTAAYIAYCGFFDQQNRQSLWKMWLCCLQTSKVVTKPHLVFSDFMSTADDRAQWSAAGLPSDELCAENAIMLARAERYPLVIDPAGQALSYLTETYRERKVVITSFMDSAFMKTLESALRFGNPLIIQDVESYDPVLNPILNRETKRAGGRVLVRLGTQEVDVSPAFQMFLITRDPSIQIPTDVSSRVNVVNFTMTHSSLQSQCLDRLLQAERPDTERKRKELSRLQGDYAVRLRFLEKSLLRTLNEASGSILEDDNVTKQLEALKTEAKMINDKVLNMEESLSEVEAVTTDYLNVAQASSSIYFLLERLSSINHCYRFSLQYFFDIFDQALLHNLKLRGVRDHTERRRLILDTIFKESHHRTIQALLYHDHLVLSASLTSLYLQAVGDQQSFEILKTLASSPRGSAMSKPSELSDILSDEEWSALQNSLPASQTENLVQQLMANADSIKDLLHGNASLLDITHQQTGEEYECVTSVRLLLSAALRPDYFASALNNFIREMSGFEVEIGFTDIASVVQQVSPINPVVIACVPGFDASNRVDEYALASGKLLFDTAMGSKESEIAADQAISDCARNGSILLLRNGHLSPGWLAQLDKRMHGLKAHPDFRLFISLEISSRIPVNLLRHSRLLMNEPAPGIKASMLDSLAQISPHQDGPVEKTRLQVIIAFFHAIVQERLRFLPLGWTKAYEFNDADLRSSLRTADRWLNKVAKGKANLDPALIPWKAIRALLKTTVYGGKIDSAFDQSALDAFIDAWFRPEAYDIGFSLETIANSSESTLQLPDVLSLDQYIAWVKKLPDHDPCTWLGLPEQSERMIAEAQGRTLLAKLREIQSPLDNAIAPTESDTQNSDWSKTLAMQSQTWLKELLPESLGAFCPPSSMPQPINRCFEREFKIGANLLAKVRSDLESLVSFAEEDRMSNDVRTLMERLVQDRIPPSWNKFDVLQHFSLSQWLQDFTKRLEHVRNCLGDQSKAVNLGLLFQPEAYMTATQQTEAQVQEVSLETLELQVDVGQQVEGAAFALEGLSIEGGDVSYGALSLNDGGRISLPVSTLRWVSSGSLSASVTASTATLPVYLNSDRQRLLFKVDVKLSGSVKATTVAQVGCSLIAA